ncbi:hypothetical protein CWC17_13000 [Pseudoalteromonas sp. S3785]|uniref:hypothetical protein n=1 Tax=Pseudoalteromonas sp. S3785 TaxID=579545 RepID=UPI00110A767B|nr:hypothetical protein [Pseudoalteromonas sp. S3785]TMO72737.1 hypothetical protein CWC17_13000 [Pseudoalteromonas sp. S3785]
MSETEAYIQLIAMVGILLCLPYCGYVFYNIGKLITAKLFPPKYLFIEITDEEGLVRIEKIDLEDNQELIKKLLRAKSNFNENF